MLFNFDPSQKDNLYKKKQRLQVKDKLQGSTKIKIMDCNFKPQVKRKFSHHDLKNVFWTGVNKQIHNPNHTPLKIIKNNMDIPKNQSNFNQDTTSKKQFLNPIQNQYFQQKNRQKTNFDNLKGFEMTFNKIFLPSILKNGKSQGSIERLLEKDLLQNKQRPNFTKTTSLDQPSPFNKGQQNESTFKKFKSRSVINLKNKLKLQKVKLSKKEKVQSEKEEIQNERSSRNQNELSPQQSSNQSPRSKKKKFHINNLNLNAPQVQNQVVTKRSYVLKMLQNHDKLFGRQQNRKNSLVNLMDRQNVSLKKSSMNFYQDDNFIARSITFSHPEELLLKKIMGKIRRQENENEKKVVRKQWQQNKISYQTSKQKLKKQIINGWDTQKQYEPNIFAIQNEQFQQI